MEYDGYGNITAKNEDVYTYDNAKWKDLLTKVGNQTISYDNQGNPISYLGHTLTWEKGRQLKSFDSNTYTYNANGIRTSKTVNGIVHNYTLEGTKILKEVWGNNTLIPLYDNEENVCGIEYNGTAYWFYKNLQGDIINIANADGDVLANYNYDAWGRLCSIIDTDGNAITDSTNIAVINPFRYRGYYYDTEIGMYYLQSRYYDSTVGRFINADDTDYLGANKISLGYNLFAYCENKAVCFADFLGFEPINITNRLLYLMRIHADYLYNLARKYVYWSYLGAAIFLHQFCNLVKTGGTWDLKSQSEWKNLRKGEYYTLFGTRVSAEDIGNIHFGYVGSVVFSLKTLFTGSGLYQIYSGRSDWRYWSTFFDQPRDIFCIIWGNALWKKYYKKHILQI